MEYQEDVDEFAPANPIDANAPAEPEPLQGIAAEPVETPQEPAAEPKAPNAYDSIISQQTEQINALIAQNQSLTDQITKLVHGGAQITGSQPGREIVNPLASIGAPALSDGEDWSLESLAKDIGKRPHHG